MAWDGRNESILGAKSAADDGPPAPSQKKMEGSVESFMTEDKNKSAPAATAALSRRTVWNGRHEKILEISDKSREVVAAIAGGETCSIASVPVMNPLPSPASVSASSTTDDSKNEVIVSSSPKDNSVHIEATLQPLLSSVTLQHNIKEDETTHSTAGTSSTNLGAISTADDGPPAPSQKKMEGSVESFITEDNNKSAPAATAALSRRTVWNGRHEKILEISDNSREVVAAIAGGETCSIASVPVMNPSPSPASVSASSTTDDSKNEVIVSSPPKDNSIHIEATLQPLLSSITLQHNIQEDETTNSTAGTSTTNSTTIADMNEHPSSSASTSVEVKVVTTTTNVSLSPDADKMKEMVGTKNGSNGLPNYTSRDGNKKKNSNNKSKKSIRRASQGKITPNGGVINVNANNTRGAGNNNKVVEQGKSNSNKNTSNNRSSNCNSNGKTGSVSTGRRRAAGGRRSRGMACALKYTHPPPAHTLNVGEMSLSPPRRSCTHPGAEGKGAPSKVIGVGGTAPFMRTRRVFDPHKARAIQLAKEAQDLEDRSNYASKPNVKTIPDEKKSEEEAFAEPAREVVAAEEPPFFSIDVECVATGYGSCARGINDGCGNEGRGKDGTPSSQFNDRSHRYPGRVAMVDSDGQVLADIIIRPPKNGKGVVSYLHRLTGLTAEICLGPDAKSLEKAVDIIKRLLPKNGVLVGQSIAHDIEWLGLVPGKDFGRAVDLSEIFRQRMPAMLSVAAEVVKKKEAEVSDCHQPPASGDPSSDARHGFATRYRHFSLRHVCLNLLGTDIQNGVHDPITDARYSLLLFHKYRNLSVAQLRIVRDSLHRAPITRGFAAENTPVIDGVCVSRAGYPYKRAARRIWGWYANRREGQQRQGS